MGTQVKRPSWVPLIVSVVAITLSLSIYLVKELRFSPLIYLGYVFTPFLPILALAFARSQDTKARSNVFYDLSKGKKIVTTTLYASIIGFVIAIPVMYHIASKLSQI